MAEYTLKLFQGGRPHTSQKRVVGCFTFVAADNEAAITQARVSYADALLDCDHALISGRHGRVVWAFTR